MHNFITNPAFCLLIALVITLVGTPIARSIALKFNIVDKPDFRRIHHEPTPYLGGLFIYIAIIVAGFFAITNFMTLESLAPVSLFVGLTLVFLAGLLDDLFSLPAGVKMISIGVAASLLYVNGFSVEFTQYHFINYPLTLFWFLGITNSANLMDNMNGLASGCSVITSLFMAYLAYLRSDPSLIGLALAVAGAYLGFLKYNFPKAKIFLGDSGSIILGFSLAALGLMVGRHTGPMTTLAPIFLVGLFVFDTFFVAFSRWARKIYFWEGGLDHTSHRFVSLGFSNTTAVMMVWGINVVFGLNAVILWHSSIAYGTALAIIIFLLGIAFWRRLDQVPIIEKNETKK
ncbi:undecaprenyl/decaprenyl-phosphate alpha-N-acetylglucosaminyl 1-phosphate transferase [bacterium]|nr:undecaprenyl/decaprenyl-phosphate alpha-N-acetylglucosaminyl 1-phosphate transferase [bacterium]MBU1024940.1 undecaprenyl/decaprenyl-phosphate alpha-N-acetylglucosaminyl 1-phosphate transferase [bacterium]